MKYLKIPITKKKDEKDDAVTHYIYPVDTKKLTNVSMDLNEEYLLAEAPDGFDEEACQKINKTK